MKEKAKIWYFTDIHGSNACFRKFLNLVKNDNKPNVLIIGGDITGKQIIPIVEDENDVYKVPIGGKELKVHSAELSELEKKLADMGYYTYKCTNQEYKNFIYDETIQRNIFNKLVKERLEDWVKLADAKLPSSDECKVIINAGNDDPFFVDAILDSSLKIIRGEGKVIDLPAGLKLLSLGYSTPTPWKCPRDISEAELKIKIAAMTSQVQEKDKDSLIFNFHCPPKNSSLDLANKIDEKTFKPAAGLGGSPTINVGSTSVREAIEFWNPIVSFHGHIHEINAKEHIGKTVCYNPGTDYANGRLQGVYIQINDAGVIEYQTLTYESLTDNVDSESETILSTIFSSIPILGGIYKNYTSTKKQKELGNKLKEVQKEITDIKELLKKEQKKNNNGHN